MKVQKVKLPNGTPSWTVIDNNYLPIKPISEFLIYLVNTGNRPYTIRGYANHLKLYWMYLRSSKIDWKIIKLSQLAGFVSWLRSPIKSNKVISLPSFSQRKASTINTMLSCISSFYQYHNTNGETKVDLTKEANYWQRSRYQGLLHHVYKNCHNRKRAISLKENSQIPKTITKDQHSSILSACTNKRDCFLISLLHDTGLRIGQALALHHSDIVSWNNEIKIQQHENNINEVYNKSAKANTIHVTPALMSKYNEYMEYLGMHIHSEYVFIDIQHYKPLTYQAAYKIFKRISKSTGIRITPHMYRHTHATELLEFGWDASYVRKRLGHSTIQTTIDTYSHLSDKSVKKAYLEFMSSQESINE